MIEHIFGQTVVAPIRFEKGGSLLNIFIGIAWTKQLT